MEKQPIDIQGIPAMLWGGPSDKLFIAVHGDQSNKEDTVISIFSEEAVQKGYRVVSFDLPQHGDRKDDPRLSNVQNGVADLTAVMAYAHTIASEISLFGCSVGAYFSLLAYEKEPIQQALFLSPVVDMERLIRNMMRWFDVSEERLKQEQSIQTPIQTLYWDYFQYVVDHPVRWDKTTAILYGRKDELVEYDRVLDFCARSGADLTVYEEGAHFFHTDEDLAFYQDWLREHIQPA